MLFLSTVFNDELYALVKSRLTKDKSKAFIMYVQRFMDKNSEIINHNIPSKRLFFYPEDLMYPFKLLDITLDDVELMVKKIKSDKNSWGILNKVNFPLNFLMICFIKYYNETKDSMGMQATLSYLTLYQYASSLYQKYYKYLPNENCMQFTYNRISDKYYFRKYQTIYKALMATTLKNHDSMKKLLLSKQDMDLLSYILSLRNRLNNQMKQFASEYYRDFNSKKYLNYTEDSNDPDNYVETSNISGDILNILNNVYNSFTSSKVDVKILRLSCGIAKVEQGVLKTALENLKDNEIEGIRVLILSMIQLYLNNNKNSIRDVGSQKFFTYMMSMYSKTNSKNEITVEIKKNLDLFLNKYCSRYSNTDREATKVSYRKALYIYMILLINDKH